MAFATEGFAAVSQNYISKDISSNFYPKLPFLAALGALTLGNNNKTTLQIGRPGAGEILSGRLVTPAEKLSLGSINRYRPRIQRFETSNSKWMGARDTRPTVASATTLSHGQAPQATADFGWAKLVTPVLIWHEDKERAGQSGSNDGRSIAMAQLINEATEVALQEHVKSINTGIWTGSPTNQAEDPWDTVTGIATALSATNIYGNINRGDSTNSAWRAQVDSTITSPNVGALIDDANVTKGIRNFGPGINLLMCGSANYIKFKNQILSSGGGGVILQNGIPKMAELGVRQEVLQKDNVYIMYDSTIDTIDAGGGAGKGVYGFTMNTWRLAVHPQHNFKVTPFVDISDKAEGAKEADQAFISTKLIFSCNNPYLNVVYTSIG